MTLEEKFLGIYKEIKEEISQPVMKIALKEESVTIFDSKVGGIPYMPSQELWPLDEEGRQLRLLAQIHCRDLQGLKMFPQTGILQFFIKNDNDLWGLNLDDSMDQRGFRVLYHENVDNTVTEEMVKSFLAQKEEQWEEDEYFPVNGEYKMNFMLGRESLSISDYRMELELKRRFQERFPEDEVIDFWDLEEEVYDAIMEEDGGQGHKVSGYPFFTQSDPREEGSEHNILLFQLDSEFGVKGSGDKVMWGDSGVGNFFIREEDLKKLDFSNILYNWDCC
ncbi:MAG TPA: DUF1963 domain-containing protein [Lachnospiraceae bacterium]|nr:DUF1963 domain-containing protein [Lachnospiraceae bacterium]